jgi:hypothetical protein
VPFLRIDTKTIKVEAEAGYIADKANENSLQKLKI